MSDKTEHNLEAGAFVAFTIAFLMGASDVLLFTLTRPNLLLFGGKKATEEQLERSFTSSDCLGDQ
jgi:hypothetical protein